MCQKDKERIADSFAASIPEGQLASTTGRNTGHENNGKWFIPTKYFARIIRADSTLCISESAEPGD